MKVSIVIPVYNGSNYLEQAIISALQQDYTDLEVVVVNDGSTDNGLTESIAKSFGNRIRYLSKTNGGVASALNVGIKEAKGKYISWLSHDDLYLPDKVSSQMFELKKYADDVILFSGFSIINQSGVILNDVLYQDLDLNFMVGEFLKHCRIHGCTLLIPKSILIESGGFNEQLKHFQDYDLWIRLARQHRFVYLSRSLVLGRQHSEQDSVKKNEAATCEIDSTLSKILISNSNYIEEKLGKKVSQFYYQSYLSYKTRSLNKCARFSQIQLAKSSLHSLKSFRSLIKTFFK